MQGQDQELKGEYTKVKDERNKTGEGIFPYFYAMDEILGHKPATQPPAVVNSIQDVATDSGDDAGDYHFEGNEPKEKSAKLDVVQPSFFAFFAVSFGRYSYPPVDMNIPQEVVGCGQWYGVFPRMRHFDFYGF